MQTEPPEPSPLLQLPPELLRQVWQELRANDSVGPVHQHALRCTCRAVRDASDAWISSARVIASSALPASFEEDFNTNDPLAMALFQLSCYPQSAVLHQLVWICRFNFLGGQMALTAGMYRLLGMQHARDLLPSFLFQVQHRLSSLRSFTLNCQDVSCGDIATLVVTCPQLQHLVVIDADVTGPVFAPLQHLSSLSSLTLLGVCVITRHQAQALSSLSSLTTLTKLLVTGIGGDRGRNTIASPALLPYLASLSQLQDLHLGLVAEGTPGVDAAAAGEALAQHISGLQYLTSLQVWGCSLPPICPALACAPYLSNLAMPSQMLDTNLIRMFAAMPRLTCLTVWGLHPDTDLSQLPCSWEEVCIQGGKSLQQLLWLPRGIGRLTVIGVITWEVEIGDSNSLECLDSIRSMAEQVGQLLTEKPGWGKTRLHARFKAAHMHSQDGPASRLQPQGTQPTQTLGMQTTQATQAAHTGQDAHASQDAHTGQDARASQGAHALQGAHMTQGNHSTQEGTQCMGTGALGAWAALFQALVPMQQWLCHLVLAGDCGLGAESAVQGARWLPALRHLAVDPLAPGFSSFVEGLGDKAWPQELILHDGEGASTGGTVVAQRVGATEGVFEALRQLAVKRASAGHSLAVCVGRWGSPAQKDVLRQAAAQHSRPGCSVLFE